MHRCECVCKQQYENIFFSFFIALHASTFRSVCVWPSLKFLMLDERATQHIRKVVHVSVPMWAPQLELMWCCTLQCFVCTYIGSHTELWAWLSLLRQFHYIYIQAYYFVVFFLLVRSRRFNGNFLLYFHLYFYNNCIMSTKNRVSAALRDGRTTKWSHSVKSGGSHSALRRITATWVDDMISNLCIDLISHSLSLNASIAKKIGTCIFIINLSVEKFFSGGSM